MTRALHVALALLLTLWGSVALAQPTPQPAPQALAPVAEPGSQYDVLLLTVGQGDILWERFGHNAIWIRDRTRGVSVAFNWGTFDFNQPHFIKRFLTGDTRYWMVANNAEDDIERYTEENRPMWAQELDLAPAQKLALVQFIQWNSREENRYYRYDYYLDNCSTRVRDAIDRVIGGALRAATAKRMTGTTYRSHTRRLLAGGAAVYTGIQLALGRPADRELSAWEESFLPERLMRYVRDVRVAWPDGSVHPLVKSERVIFAAKRPPELESAPDYLLTYLGSGLALGALLAALGRAAARGTRGAAAGFGAVAGVWTLLCGIVGTLVLLAGTVTRHIFWARNFNLAAYSPLALIALALIVAAVGLRRAESRVRWARRGERVGMLIAALTVIGWLGALVVGQRSGEVFALAVPANIALWWALRALANETPRVANVTRAAK